MAFKKAKTSECISGFVQNDKIKIFLNGPFPKLKESPRDSILSTGHSHCRSTGHSYCTIQSIFTIRSSEMFLIKIKSCPSVRLFIDILASFLQFLSQRFRSTKKNSDSRSCSTSSSWDTVDDFVQLGLPIRSSEFRPVTQIGEGVVSGGSITRRDFPGILRIPASSQEDVIGEEFVVALGRGCDGGCGRCDG